MRDKATRRVPVGWQVLRPQLVLHGVLLLLVVGISWWGEGAAFLILYGVVLTLAALLIGAAHGAAFIRARFTRTSGIGASPEDAASKDAFLPWRLTRWILLGLWIALAAALLAGLGVGIVARYSEPIGSFPGGSLSGELVPQPPADWSFLDEFEMIQLEVSPDSPRSVNVHAFVHEGKLYVGADFYFPFKRWVHVVTRDGRVTIRARGKLYPLLAVRVSDAEEVALTEELERRLASWRGLDPDTAPGFQTDVWLFRLDPR